MLTMLRTLFYLIKYLYEEKVCFTELEEEFKILKLKLKNEPTIEYDELFPHLG